MRGIDGGLKLEKLRKKYKEIMHLILQKVKFKRVPQEK